MQNERRGDGMNSIQSCGYCFAVFDMAYWSWCCFSNEDDNSFVILCSLCAADILNNQESDKVKN